MASGRQGHARDDSFGEFVSPDTPPSDARGIIDLREVERQLDAKREAEATRSEATAMAAIDPSLSMAAEPITAPTQLTEEPQPIEPSASGRRLWGGALWSKLASLGALEKAGKASSALPRASVERRARTIETIPGAPGFDPSVAPRWNTGAWFLSGTEERRREQKPIPVTLRGRREDTSIVCDEWRASRIQALLPRRLRLGKSWQLLYSLDQDGSSLGTLYDLVQTATDSNYRRGMGGEQWLRGSSTAAQQAMLGTKKSVGTGVALPDAGIVISVRDAHGNVFGAFVNEPLKIAPHYYGNGECFLWKTVRRRLPCPPSELTEPDLHPDMAVEVFRWTGKNDYMVLSEADYFSVGGGDGRYGLWLDAALERGLSARCPAFNNHVLCNNVESDAVHATDSDGVPTGNLLGNALHHEPIPDMARFTCMGVEVWAVGMD
ncbi:oxidation resistance protein 1 [Malassezia vespertilionis]|uniref:Oxidation resistance protein 1 n=1 Tax=Malassezia vespertilionis TaxID=2020962 RepID=A0A2N1JB26_9BASI|nr:oxidation resistance protein 1 [Malassezia vespertilionis]PKI83749.1 Oxr1p [Malassezia vespertilionis]WFD07329.1 oxidation resistance protein 1 [Malassezia vespertilionis]